MSDYNDRPMTTTDWFLTLLVLAIPGLNVILYIVWAFGAGNRNRVNFCRASILWTLIILALYAFVLAAGFGLSLWN